MLMVMLCLHTARISITFSKLYKSLCHASIYAHNIKYEDFGLFSTNKLKFCLFFENFENIEVNRSFADNILISIIKLLNSFDLILKFPKKLKFLFFLKNKLNFSLNF
jgi:hypothetical protein